MTTRTPTLLTVAATALTASTLHAQALPTSATIDAEPLNLTAPERYQVVSTLEPIRRVPILAPADGVIRSLDASAGTTIREGQQIAEIERAEAAARLKIAEAELRERQALVAGQPAAGAAKAQVDAAEARVELARVELERLTLRAPFAGRIVATQAASGQYVLKGTVIAELADVTMLKAITPVDRRLAKPGEDVSVYVEDEEKFVKVHSIAPLPTTDEYKPLRELAAPFAAAWIQVPNPKGELEPGLRVRSASLPASQVAVVPRSAVKPPSGGVPDSVVQVIRAEHVVDVRVKPLGNVGPERLQVTGAFRSSDALIVSTSVPLLPGTFVRFGAEGKVEGAPPDRNQPGQPATVAPTPAPVTDAPTRPATKSQPRRPAPAQPAGATPF